MTEEKKVRVLDQEHAKGKKVNVINSTFGQELSEKEEQVMRMKHGASYNKETQLSSKTNDPKLKKILLAIELRAFAKSGRLEELLQKEIEKDDSEE